MGKTRSKAQELIKLCRHLRAESIHFWLVTRQKRGEPDIVLGGRCGNPPIAVWLRRADESRTMSREQLAEIDRAAGLGWYTLIAFGARGALEELYSRGVGSEAGRKDFCYAVSSSVPL